MEGLSARAMRVIGDAVRRLSDEDACAEWARWSDHERRARDADGGAAAVQVAMPPRVVEVAIQALDARHAALASERDAADEDERFYFDNDLSFLDAVNRGLLAAAG